MEYVRERWWPGWPGVIAAAIVLVVGPPEALFSEDSTRPVIQALLTVVLAAGLFLRRLAPFPLLVGSFLILGINDELTLGEGTFAGVFGAAAATMNVGYEVRSPWCFLAVPICLVMSSVLPAVGIGPGVMVIDVVAITVLYGAVVLGGWLFRQRNDQADMLRALAAQLEAEREQHARHAVEEERTRIARELHDIVSHSISLVVIQLQAIRRRIGPENPGAADDLREVETAGRQAMAEMRRMLGVLRVQGGALDLEPQPGLSQLPRLLDQTRTASLAVDYTCHGVERALPPGVDLAAYRIVQESLTNVLKHANATTASVTITYGDRGIDIAVVDDGRGPSRSRSGANGNGLLGIRERVTIYGGTLDYGAASPRGFRVEAHLPVREEALRD